jgi:L-threonylcarbamoyladenylate synthase
LPSRGGVADLVQGGLPTIALRVPAHPVAQAVLAAFGGPVAAPSANPSGAISPTLATHVLAGLGARVDAVLDGGACGVGVESTILAPGPDGVRLLREGGIAREALEALVGPVIADLTPGRVEAPGQMERHYAPQARLLMGGAAQAGEVTIGFGSAPGDLSLSEQGDLVEAAARLFATLHAADALAQARGASVIRVAEVPDVGLGRAINDRLRRATKG